MEEYMVAQIQAVVSRFSVALASAASARVALQNAERAQQEALGELKELFSKQIETITREHASSSASATYLAPCFKNFTLEFIPSVGIHVRFSRACNREGAEPPHYKTPLTASESLNVVTRGLNSWLCEEHADLHVAYCTVPDHYWSPDEIAKLPIY